MPVVGVDGGTTKTIALVANDQGEIIGAARGGGSNWSGENVEIPMTVVADTVNAALAQAGVTCHDVASGVFTLAGADWPEDHTRRQAFLEQAGICSRVIVKNDSFGGLRAGTSKPYGIVIAAGTGFNAAVITPDGQEWAFGYYETGGGAGTVSWDAFVAVLRAEDRRGQPTLLTDMVLQKLGFPTVEAMLRAHIAQQIERRQYLSLCPLVFDAALSGDPVAAGIITRQGEILAEYATAIIRRFNLHQLEFDVVLAGSVFKGVGPLLVDTVTQIIHQSAPRASIVRARFEPAVGSVLLAYDNLNIPVTDAMYRRLTETAPAADLFYTADGGRPRSIATGEEE